MASYVIWLVIFFNIHVVYGQESRDGIMDTLSNGMKIVNNFLGTESVAQKVAEFVVRAFQNRNPYNKPINRRPQEQHSSSSENFSQEKRPDYTLNEVPMSPLRNLVRLLGLQPNQISAVAVNALVFVAQMISTFIAGPKRRARPTHSDDPSNWILNKNSRKLQDLISHAKNESLPSQIEDLIDNTEDTSCIRLLVCKITPFVTKMQKAVFGNDSGDTTLTGSAVLYRHLPSSEEIETQGGVCEKKHKECDLNE